MGILKTVSIILLLAGSTLTTAAGAESQPANATEAISQATIDWFDAALGRVDQMKPVAEAVADKLLDGGRLWAAGNSGFREELFFRVGGFPFLKMWPGTGQTPQKDVFLYGQLTPNEPVPNYERLSTLMIGARFKNNMTVVFASRRWPQISRVLDAVDPERYANRVYFIDTDAPLPGDSIQNTCVAQVATLATAWAFQGEVIAAVTRKGKMLATYASAFEKDPGQTDESVKDFIVNPKYTVAPVEAGKLGREYLKACRDQLARFSSSQAASVRQAAERLTQCMKQGGMVWAIMVGHVHLGGTQTPPELPIKNFGREFEWEKFYMPKLPKSDLVVWLGYVEYPENQVKGTLERGCEIVTVSCDEGAARAGVVNIRSPIDRLDACVSIPEYPLRMLPTSGVVQSVIWYSLMAETRSRYAAR